MNASLHRPHPSTGKAAGRAADAVMRAAWMAVRLPILAVLAILEPVVRVVLAGAALLLTLMALFFGLVHPVPAPPVWGMVGVAVGCFLLLALYYALLRVLSL